MSTQAKTVATCHKMPWSKHETVLRTWKSNPPVHPANPRYRAYDFSVEGRYSLFESIVNAFRQRGWLDAPPAEYKWAIVTVSYRAPRDPRDYFVALSSRPAPESGEGDDA